MTPETPFPSGVPRYGEHENLDAAQMRRGISGTHRVRVREGFSRHDKACQYAASCGGNRGAVTP